MKNERISIDFDEQILTPAKHAIICPVHTIPLNEFKVRDYCKTNGIMSYLPLKKTIKVHAYQSRGKPYRYSRVVLRPMFPSYIFLKVSDEQRIQLLTTRLIVRFLDSTPQEKLLEDIKAVHALEMTSLQQEIEYDVVFKEGDCFRIESGVWDGVTGWLVNKDKRYLWTVELEFLNQFIRTTINPFEYKMKRVEE